MKFDKKVPSNIQLKLEQLFNDITLVTLGGNALLKDVITLVNVSPYSNKIFILELDHIKWIIPTIQTLGIKLPSLCIFLQDEFALNISITGDSIIEAGDYSQIALNDSYLPVHERRKIIIIAENEQLRFSKGIPYYTVSKSLELYKFPPNHPIVNTVYAMIDIYPNHYIPFSQFHDYYKETKHAAFIELCAALGAKEICIESAEINSKNLDINGDIKTPLLKLGLGLNIHEDHETGQKVVFSFSETNKGIKDYDSPWLYTEPSWKSMNILRRENRLLQLGAEFNCIDEMGIDVNLAGNIKLLGFNIGGKFSEMTKIKLSYRVIFWE